MSDEGIEGDVREYVAFYQIELRDRGLLDGDRLDPEFRLALVEALRGEPRSGCTAVAAV